MATGLTAKVLAVHEALDAAGLPHAFGGAFALAFCTAEPRATQDIDVNIFVGLDRVDDVRAALPPEIIMADAAETRLRREGQARLWWERTPIDVFLSNHPFHHQAEANRRLVPFAGVDVPVLACADLAVFKAFYARLQDAVDVALMADVGSIDLVRLRRVAAELLGGDEERAAFFARVDEARQA